MMRRTGQTTMLLAYLATALLAVIVWQLGSGEAAWLRTLTAGLAGTGLLWLVGALRGNPSVFDPYWSIAPIGVAMAWAYDPASAGACVIRQFVVLCLVCAWGMRLTYHWWRTFPGLEHEDWRYTDMRRASGRLFPAVNLVVIHFLPTLMLLLACAAMYPALVTGTRDWGLLDGFASLWTLAAIGLEARADREMRAFRARPREAGSVYEAGVWAWLRHPNYLGELSFWWGLWLFSMAADPDAAWSAAGPAVITAMLVLYSAPALDRRMAQRSPTYREYMARVPSLLPRRPARP